MVLDPLIYHETLAFLVPGGVMVAGLIFVGGPLAKAFAQRIAGPSRAPLEAGAAADLARRLERIEQAVETVAVEVERIAEAQRFAAQLQARQGAAPLPPGR